MKKIETYFLENSISYKGKTVAITGATGSLGYWIAYYMLLKDARVVLVGRNEEKLKETKENFAKIFNYPDIKYLVSDASKIEDTMKLVDDLEKLHIDFLFNNAGCYHLPVKMIGKHDVTYVTNFITPIILTRTLCRRLPKLTVVQTSSLSQRFAKTNLKDIELIESKNKTKRYGSSKRLFALASLQLQNELANNIYITHPGVSTTTLFSSSKGGFNKAFSKIIVPIMKVIFMKPEKAALNIALAPTYSYKKEKIIGPRGLFQVWGYPKEHNFKFKSFKKYEQEKITEIISSLFEE